MRALARHVSAFAELLLPSGCVGCGDWIPAPSTGGRAVAAGGVGDMVCLSCRNRLREASWPRCPRCHHPRGTARDEAPDCLACRDWPLALGAARSAFVLRSPASELVHGLKYGGWRDLSSFMGDRMARALGKDRSGAFPQDGRRLVVPVPTTARRRRARGYNQAELLANRVAAVLRLPVREALRRVPSGPSQTSLGAEARRDNVRGVFRADPDGVAGAAVLLVDDVLTTGATAGEAASTLVGAGAGLVVLLTFARTLPEDATG